MSISVLCNNIMDVQSCYICVHALCWCVISVCVCCYMSMSRLYVQLCLYSSSKHIYIIFFFSRYKICDGWVTLKYFGIILLTVGLCRESVFRVKVQYCRRANM